MPWKKSGEYRAVDLVRHFQSGIDQKFIRPDERFVVIEKSNVVDVSTTREDVAAEQELRRIMPPNDVLLRMARNCVPPEGVDV